jgi:hypothetical protein
VRDVVRKPEYAAGEDFGAEATAVFEEHFGAGGVGLVHPIAGCAFARAQKPDALDFKFFADEGVEVGTGSDDVAAESRGRGIGKREVLRELVEDLGREESHLALVVIFVVEKPITAQAAARDALDGGDFCGRMRPRGLAVVAEVVVARRDVKMEKLHDGLNQTLESGASNCRRN